MRVILRVGGSIVILGVLLVFLPFDDLKAAVLRIPPLVWPLAIGAYLSIHVIGVAKWRMLVNVAGAGLSFRDASRSYYWGLFGNTFLPSVAGGDVVKIGTALRSTKSKTGLVFGSFTDRALDVVGLMLIAGFGAILSPSELEQESRRVFLVAVVIAFLVAIASASLVMLLPMRNFPFGFRRKIIKARNAFLATAGRPFLLGAALLLGMLLQSLLVVLNYSLGLIIGISIPLYVWLFVWPLAKISALLPVTQGGIGVREVAIAALFAPFGVSATKAVASGLVFEAVVIAAGLLAGAVAFGRGRMAVTR